MPFIFEKTEIEELMLITPHIVPDKRGYYKKYYEKDIFFQHGITGDFTESSDIISRKGALRGLHYQSFLPQAKLLHVISGEIYDVAVDIRKDSPTFGAWKGYYLKAEEGKVLYIPEGFAHGFLALEENTIFSYQCTGKYIPEACGGIRWNDIDLNIKWPIDRIKNLIMTEKDINLGSFSDYKKLIF